MQIFYIDESGTSFRDRSSPFFLLAALTLDLQECKRMDSDLGVLKQGIFPYMTKSEDFEIKGRDIRRGDGVFKSLSWEQRLGVLRQVTELVVRLPCQIFSVTLDKRSVQGAIECDEDAYRITFSRLLDASNEHLERIGDLGFILMDSRSDLHSSVQDRRLIDAYRAWQGSCASFFPELPWFGFSAFYGGLQLADFCAYMLDFLHNEMALPDTVSSDFRTIQRRRAEEALLESLRALDLRKARRILDSIGCRVLPRLINKQSAAAMIDIVAEDRDISRAYEQLVNPTRYADVASLAQSLLRKVHSISIP